MGPTTRKVSDPQVARLPNPSAQEFADPLLLNMLISRKEVQILLSPPHRVLLRFSIKLFVTPD
jgi:hypothetical protein